ILCQLSDAGVEFALDDFGSGYSTLSYLKYFPVSYIKVDKTFIRDVLWEDTSRHIVECVVSLAEKIGVRTVAEGVETQAQAKYLQALGIYYFQGYYFGRPQTLTVFRKGGACD
ncbi:TPA: EAL domain-containing protein, partial [Escherichia coli]|nr:EAL domain-containing protein [Escherichia coli]HAN6325825.1 EAL domain-containing protein [Escherichia coli]